MGNIELWKLIASISIALIGVVTAPIIWAVKTEAGKLKAELKLDKAALELGLEKNMAALKVDLEKMEGRLNERIGTLLTHR